VLHSRHHFALLKTMASRRSHTAPQCHRARSSLFSLFLPALAPIPLFLCSQLGRLLRTDPPSRIPSYIQRARQDIHDQNSRCVCLPETYMGAKCAARKYAPCHQGGCSQVTHKKKMVCGQHLLFIWHTCGCRTGVKAQDMFLTAGACAAAPLSRLIVAKMLSARCLLGE